MKSANGFRKSDEKQTVATTVQRTEQKTLEVVLGTETFASQATLNLQTSKRFWTGRTQNEPGTTSRP